MTKRYEGIAKVCFMIALENGGINRDRSEEAQQAECEAWIEWYRAQHSLSAEDIADINSWLLSLPEEDLGIVAGYEDDEKAMAVMGKAPIGTDDLLNDYFDQVC